MKLAGDWNPDADAVAVAATAAVALTVTQVTGVDRPPSPVRGRGAKCP
ncbi:hypothetical protein [Nonomuraea sp. NPDC048916]